MVDKYKNAWSCDFETLNDNGEYTYVWAWAACQINNPDNIKYGTTIESFIDFIKGKPLAYFHNAKFDFSFIIDHLMKNGFKYYEHDARFTPELNENEKDPRIKTFTLLKTDNNVVYSMDITWNIRSYTNKEGKQIDQRVHTELRDSAKLIPTSVEKMGVDYKVGLSKGSIDYKAHYERGGVLKQEYKDYIKNDVQIVAKVLNIFFDEGYTDLTIGANALRIFKEILGKENFEKYLPQLDYEIDEFCRKSYRGGYVFVNPLYAGKDIDEGIVADVNSLFPDRMYNCDLPYGNPLYYDGCYKKDKKYPLYIQHVWVKFHCKPNHLPCIQLKNNSSFVQTEYVYNVDEPVELYLTSVDLDLLKSQYYIDEIDYVDGYKFKSCNGLFKDYIDKYMEIKKLNAETKNALYAIAKLFLNSLYGKLGTNPIRTSKYPVLNIEDEVIEYKATEPKIGKSVYIPQATFITAYARYKTITTGQKYYDRFLYADTDSLHLMGSDVPSDLDVDKSRLGAWDIETRFRRARFLRPKCYIEEYYNEKKQKWVLNVKCAGLPEKCKTQVTWENFHINAKYEGKLMPKIVKGGTILQETTFIIKKA